MALDFKFKAEQVIESGRTTKKCVETIKNWLITTELPKIQDELVVLFLLSCKNDVHLTKKTVEAHFKAKMMFPELFDNRDVDVCDEIQQAMRTMAFSCIPTRTKENYVIQFMKFIDVKYYNFNIMPLMKVSNMLFDISLENNPPDGIIFIVDLKGFSIMHMTRLKPIVLKRYMDIFQEGLPIEVKAIHLLNSVYFFDKLFFILKSIMKSEIVNMIKTHTPDVDYIKFFEEYVPAECMPKDYGGDLPSMVELNRITIQQFRDKKSYYEAEEKMRKIAQ